VESQKGGRGVWGAGVVGTQRWFGVVVVGPPPLCFKKKKKKGVKKWKEENFIEEKKGRKNKKSKKIQDKGVGKQVKWGGGGGGGGGVTSCTKGGKQITKQKWSQAPAFLQGAGH